MQLKNGDMLILTTGQAVLIRKKNQVTGRFAFSSRIIFNGYTFTDIREVDNNEVWAVVPVAGFFHGTLVNDTLILKEQYFSGITCRNLHLDESDTTVMWLASDKGLIRFNSKTREYKLYDESGGMANCFVYGYAFRHYLLPHTQYLY